MPKDKRIHVMGQADVRSEIARLAREIVERSEGAGLVLMGVHRRGTDIAGMLQDEIRALADISIPTGSIDITLYRDDLGVIGPRPVIGETVLPSGGIDDQEVVLVDDVIYTGRTIRAALNELSDWGRPRRIRLCVLVDRGGRELPVQPDMIGKKVDVLEGQYIEVLVEDLDGRLAVDLIQVGPRS
jgi:pyrimidine operon attenuation protein/uracil phosphoribosyltransferase